MSEERKRTKDVLVEDPVQFSQLLLKDEVMKGLAEAGFKNPSPIQLRTIPLGKSNIDIIAQAKSGTGKTIVFSVIALEKINLSLLSPQVIILAPTREIALQIHHVIMKICVYLKGLFSNAFIGGTSLPADIDKLSPCHIVIGTPGRVRQLIEEGWLRVDTISLFILDEVDKMLGESSLRETTSWILESLNKDIQFLSFSATYSPEVLELLKSTMKSPQEIMLDEERPSLEGVKQYYYEVPKGKSPMLAHLWKQKKVVEILSNLSFHQCFIFCNNKSRADSLATRLQTHGWHCNTISSHLSQKERNKAIDNLRRFKVRVLISSDLTARGLDVDRVNLVINMDVPKDRETYLHRIGRTGRFGTHGVTISLVTEEEKSCLECIVHSYQSSIDPLPEEIPKEYYAYDLSKEDKEALENMKHIECRKIKKKTLKDEDEINESNQNYDHWGSYIHPTDIHNNRTFHNSYYPFSYNDNWNSYLNPTQTYINMLQYQYLPEISGHLEALGTFNTKKRKRG